MNNYTEEDLREAFREGWKGGGDEVGAMDWGSRAPDEKVMWRQFLQDLKAEKGLE
jgi:hypothetical protein